MSCVVYRNPSFFNNNSQITPYLPQISAPTPNVFSSHFSNYTSKITTISSYYKPDFLRPLSPHENDGEVILPIDCGLNSALLYLSKLCQGSKGPCIFYEDFWLTPNEFQLVSGRETAKDWKRSIRHNGRSLKLLITKGLIRVHSPICECGAEGQRERARRMELFQNTPNSTYLKLRQLQILGSEKNFKRNNGSNNGMSRNSIKRESRLTSIIDHLHISRTTQQSRSCSSSESESWGDSSQFSEKFQKIAQPNSSSPSPPFPISPKAASAESGEEEGVRENASNVTPSVVPGPIKTKTPRKNKAVIVKNERQSPESVRSSPSPTTGKGDAPSPPLKQMEHMMSRNYSDFMRSLAAKYNHANPNELYGASGRSSFNFDSRFLKPGAAAAAASLLAFQQQQVEKQLSFPLIDMSSTQTLLSMVRTAASSNPSSLNNNNPTTTNNNNNISPSSNSSLKRANSPLDLSSSTFLGCGGIKRVKGDKSNKNKCGLGSCTGCVGGSEGESSSVAGWSVEDVCRFVGSIEMCGEYVEAFREHSIDGSSLPLLTEEHLTLSMGMKLGPALKFKSALSKKIGNCPVCVHCIHCHNSTPPLVSPELNK